jgi:hypothetical protein
MRIVTELLVAIVVLGTPMTAQSVGALRVVVQDSLTGEPLIGANIQLVPLQGELAYLGPLTDSTGSAILPGLSPGPRHVRIHCPTVTNFGIGLALQTRPVTIELDTVAVVVVKVVADRCEEPPYSVVTGYFEGWYTVGFEASEFHPCLHDTIPLVAALPDPRYRTVWVTSESTSSAPAGAPLAEFRSSTQRQTWYVEWWARLEGPGSFGHLNGSGFRMVVDSVVSATTTPPPHCHERVQR